MIEIKNIFGEVLFTDVRDDVTIKDAVELAVNKKISLGFANLRYAQLNGADLRGAILDRADFFSASLIDAKMTCASLNHAVLNNANLLGANLHDSSLKLADLRNANLTRACGCRIENMPGAMLSGAKNIPYCPLFCPSDGAFIGWKKVGTLSPNCTYTWTNLWPPQVGYLVKLYIPEDAKRSSGTTRMCRCDKARVLEITYLPTRGSVSTVFNRNIFPTIYKVGEMVYPDSFDEDRWNECSHGIHFFINKQDAINY